MSRTCVSPSFLFHGQEDLRKGIDTEGRVLEPLECGGHWMLRETLAGIKSEALVRVLDSMPIPLKGGRPKASPTRPSVSGQGRALFSKPPPGGIPWRGFIGPTFWGLGRGVMTLAGVPPLDAPLSHSF